MVYDNYQNNLIRSTTTPSNDDTFESVIAIIGGDVGGLALSIGLTRAGVPHKIYEATKQFSSIGAGISCLPNAIQALSLIDPRLGECFQEIATYNESEEVSHLNVYFGEKNRGEHKYGDLILRLGRRSPEDRGRASAHRARLLDEMVKFVPPGISEFNKRMTGLRETEQGNGVEINFADGADDPAAYPVFANSYAYRTLVPRAEANAILGADLAGTGNIWLGNGSVLLQYPIDHGALVNVVAGCEDILEDFRDFGEPMLGLLEKMEEPYQRWGLFETLPAKSFCKGRICLMSDAAHAATSYQGAGASMAFEDAYIMAELLGDAMKAKEDHGITQAFKAFEAVRRRKTRPSKDLTLILPVSAAGTPGPERSELDADFT